MTEATQPDLDVFRIFENDKRMILYRPEWNLFAGSVTSSILLQQILFHWGRFGRRPFYKFKEPCSHKMYQLGDSWCEELGFSRHEFDSALRKISCKLSKSKENPVHVKPVEYWIDQSRVTYYQINTVNLLKILCDLYSFDVNSLKPETGDRKSRFPALQVKPESGDRKSRFPALLILDETETPSRERDDDDRDVFPSPPPSSFSDALKKALPSRLQDSQSINLLILKHLRSTDEATVILHIQSAALHCKSKSERSFRAYLDKSLSQNWSVDPVPDNISSVPSTFVLPALPQEIVPMPVEIKDRLKKIKDKIRAIPDVN